MLGGLADGYLNKSSYTYSSHTYWTMSPGYFSVVDTAAREFLADSAGNASSYWVSLSYGVRAVINLKSDIQISKGIGTKNDPFVISII